MSLLACAASEATQPPSHLPLYMIFRLVDKACSRTGRSQASSRLFVSAFASRKKRVMSTAVGARRASASPLSPAGGLDRAPGCHHPDAIIKKNDDSGAYSCRGRPGNPRKAAGSLAYRSDVISDWSECSDEASAAS
jgi:hypothetical protein